ncbi:MAG: hypothetical protein N2485_07780 [bacterium]|nr:hypothetical protein [bacterium]
MFRVIVFAIIFIVFNILFIFSANMVGVIYKKDENYFYSKLYSILPKDTVLDVYRSSNKVGKVKIVSLVDNVALLSVLEGNIQTGDLLYYDFEIKNSTQQENKELNDSNKNNSNYLMNKAYISGDNDENLPYDKLNDGLKYYSQVLATKTKIVKFGPNSNAPATKIVLDPFQIFSLYNQYESYKAISSYSNISPVTSSISNFFLLQLISNLWNTYQNVKGPTMNESNIPSSYIQIVYLDEDLAKARTILHGYKETIYDKAYLSNYYKNLVSSTQLNDFAIFEVTIFNGFNQPINLSPFSYKLYLIGSNGLRYKAIKYDITLDTNLSPGGSANGFVYFPKYDIQTGENITKSKIKLSIEEIGPLKQEIVSF